ITGSVRAGMQVAESAARQVKRVHLELGGKAPAIVFPDADLDAATAGLQKCLGGPSGSAPISLSDRAVEVVRSR
ncbi:aldehyde dehydrogenase family protein, partial [Escherichia coli]|uniref:aldehyde dehydrogenase family protein n=1 Tax=Escherichia coli TaxID=562 RepID=UPI0039E1799F